MKNFYSEIDEITLTFSDIHSTPDGMEYIRIYFERPTENGFDDARCELPSYTWTEKRGFTDKEIDLFHQLLESNAHLLFRYAADGGVKIA